MQGFCLNSHSCNYICSMIIKSAKYVISSPSYDKCPEPTKPEYAFIGRSNVGKSSLINMLVNQKNLAKTSGTPGKTQLINHFEISSVPDAAGGKPQTKETKWTTIKIKIQNGGLVLCK